MAKRSGGFPGMGGNMNQLMKQAEDAETDGGNNKSVRRIHI